MSITFSRPGCSIIYFLNKVIYAMPSRHPNIYLTKTKGSKVRQLTSCWAGCTQSVRVTPPCSQQLQQRCWCWWRRQQRAENTSWCCCCCCCCTAPRSPEPAWSPPSRCWIGMRSHCDSSPTGCLPVRREGGCNLGREQQQQTYLIHPQISMQWMLLQCCICDVHVEGG